MKSVSINGDVLECPCEVVLQFHLLPEGQKERTDLRLGRAVQSHTEDVPPLAEVSSHANHRSRTVRKQSPRFFGRQSSLDKFHVLLRKVLAGILKLFNGLRVNLLVAKELRTDEANDSLPGVVDKPLALHADAHVTMTDKLMCHRSIRREDCRDVDMLDDTFMSAVNDTGEKRNGVALRFAFIADTAHYLCGLNLFIYY